MNVHLLKTDPVYFQAVVDGRKGFEVRNNDRKFEEGDVVILAEFGREPFFEPGQLGPILRVTGFSGRVVVRRVGMIVSDPALVREGYVVFQLDPAGEEKR